MRDVTHILLFLIFSLFLFFEPVAADSPPVPPVDGGEERSGNEITPEQAISAADDLIKDQNWGKHRKIQRTISNWYRIEYGHDERGVERVVLVNPATGKAEFPLPR